MADLKHLGASDSSSSVTTGAVRRNTTVRTRSGLSTFSSLTVGPYRWLLSSTVSGTLGYQMQAIALGWLVYVVTGSAVALGLITSMQAICQTGISPIGGVIADRVERRTFIMIVRSPTIVVAVAVAYLVLTQRIAYFELVIAAAIFGLSFGLNGPARQALIAELVPGDLLLNAVSLLSAGMNLMRIVGPALAGVLIGSIGVGGIYILLAMLYCAVIVQLIPVPQLPVARTSVGRNVFADLRDGLDYSFQDPAIFGLLLLGSIPLFFAMPYAPLLPVFAETVWHAGAAGYGILAAGPGVGGLIGALLVASLGKYPYKGRLMLVSTIVLGLALTAFGLSPSFLAAELALLVVGIASVIYSSLVSSLLQLNVPNDKRGRVMSFYQMSFGISGLSALPVAALATAIGAPDAIALCGVLTAVTGVAIFVFRPDLMSL